MRTAHELLARFPNGQRVRERLSDRQGVVEGTALGGATYRGGFRPHLNVRVKWDDGEEFVTSHHALNPVESGGEAR